MSNELLDALLRADFLSFCEKVFQTLNPATAFDPNWHVEAIAYALEQARTGGTKRFIVNVPPRSLKSTIVSVAFPAFLLGHNPSLRIICVSYAQPLASKLARDCRKILDAEWYRRLFPTTRLSKDAEDVLETTEGGGRLATSIGGSVTGMGGNVIIIDDPMKPDEAPSEAARLRVSSYYDNTLYSRLDDKVNGVIIVVAQRLHEDDLCGHLMRGGHFGSLIIPAIAPVDHIYNLTSGRKHHRKAGELLHPQREPNEILLGLKRQLGSAVFEAQYQQNPLPPDGNMVKPPWIKHYRQTPRRDSARITQSWDTAFKGNPGNDFSVCTTWLQKDGYHYLLDIFRDKLDFPALVKCVQTSAGHFAPDAILIEDKGSGTSLIQDLRGSIAPPVIPRQVPPGADKETRLAAVLPMFEAGKVLFPEDAPWLPELQRELFGFPNTRHDDQVDSITQYLTWARGKTKSTFEFDFGFGTPLTTGDIADRLIASRSY